MQSTEHTWQVPGGTEGHTLLPWVPFSPESVVVFTCNRPSELRVVLSSGGACAVRETRGKGGGENRLSFVVHQGSDGDGLSLGFGNPHFACSPAPRKAKTTLLAGATSYWLEVSAAEGWVVLGLGNAPSKDTVQLHLKLQPGDSRLAHLDSVSVSGWQDPLSVTMRKSSASVLNIGFAADKFNLQGQCTPLHGLTCVCPLGDIAHYPLHGLMAGIAAMVRAEPGLKDLYGLLPAESYHMTVLTLPDGANFDKKAAATTLPPPITPEHLTQGAQHLSTLDEKARAYVLTVADKLARAGISGSSQWTVFPMRITGADPERVHLEPWDVAAKVAIEAWRNAVCEKVTGHSAATDYIFHATISYPLFTSWVAKDRNADAYAALERIRNEARRRAEELQGRPVLLTLPNLCFFESMAAFHPIVARAP